MARSRFDRITMFFYKDEPLEITLLLILKELTVKRMRSNKMKELLIDYFKKEMPDLYNKCHQKALEITNEIEIVEIPKEVVKKEINAEKIKSEPVVQVIQNKTNSKHDFKFD